MAVNSPIDTATQADVNTMANAHAPSIGSPRANLYNDPEGLRGTPVQSSVGSQQYERIFYTKKIIPALAKKRKFSKLADTIAMPKNMGQRIRAEVDIPLLHDANLNDQGIDARGVHIRNGNFYGSSKDIGKILGAMPVLTEEGGRVNRVGFSRAWTEGTFNKFGFFYEYSQDLENFDSDPQIVSRMYQKAMEAAEQLTEDCLQADLLNGAGTIVYSGNAISDDTMDQTSLISYQAIRRLSRALDDNQTPRETKYIFGSTNLDTRTATTYRTLFVGPEVLNILEQMKDHFGNPAFIHAHQYGAGISKLMEDEVGIIDKFRVVYVEGMLGWMGAGAPADPQFGLAQENGKYNIYPALCIGTDAFTCISFDGSNGVNNKFQIHHQKPNQSYSLLDPYGEIGFVSIKWWYGIMFKRPERIGVIKTVAPM